MALDAVVDTKRILAFAVAGAAGFAVFHVSHGCLGAADAVGEYLGVAVSTLVGLQVEFVAEGGITGRFRELEVDDARFHTLVALGAVAGCGEDVLAVVAGTA